MTKIIYFLPAIIFTAFYGFIIIVTGLPVLQLVYVGIALFIISGTLLCKKKFWGALLGIIPGGYLMYMRTIDTGQIINIELPLGIIVTVFYFICGIYVYVRNK